MIRELKPCPVCESKNIMSVEGPYDEDGWGFTWIIKCEDCGIKVNKDDKAKAFTIWENLPRLTEECKAKIALKMIRECVLYIPASLPKEDMEALEYTEMCIKYAYGIGEEE